MKSDILLDLHGYSPACSILSSPAHEKPQSLKFIGIGGFGILKKFYIDEVVEQLEKMVDSAKKILMEKG